MQYKTPLKLFLTIITAGVLTASPLTAKGGIGIAIGDPTGITLRIEKFPVLTVGYHFFSKNGYIDANLDFWIIHNRLGAKKTKLNWYLGVGASTDIYFGANQFPVVIGARVPIGLQWIPTDPIEIYLEAAPGISVFPGVGFDMDYALGIRFLIF